MAISCDSLDDEYDMTNRVFDLTSGSDEKKNRWSIPLIRSFEKEDAE